MKFFLKQNTEGGKEVFIIYDDMGQPAYHVISDKNALSSKLILQDVAEKTVAKINRIGVLTLSRYDISVDDKECAHITQSLSAAIPKLKVHGLNWHFRGDIVLRSFDVLDIDRTLIMTHGRNWGPYGECFAIDIAKPQNELLCLCIAVAIDSMVMGGIGAVLPVGN